MRKTDYLIEKKHKKASFDLRGNRLGVQSDGWAHVYTIFPKTREELYQLYALVTTGISVAFIAIKEALIPVLQMLLE